MPIGNHKHREGFRGSLLSRSTGSQHRSQTGPDRLDPPQAEDARRGSIRPHPVDPLHGSNGNGNGAHPNGNGNGNGSHATTGPLRLRALLTRREAERSRPVVGKRAFDILAAAVLLVLAAPLLLVCAALIKLTSRGPVIFRHRRCGVGNRPFWCYKFRTMVHDAEEWLDEDEELRRLHRENGFKLPRARDPRITSVGHFLRYTHLDELPQLWNVLRGEMSLVGPRPIVEEELRYFGAGAEELLTVRPGIFGEWTALGRDRPRYPERVDVELDYARAPSLRRDVSILLRNLPVLVNGQEEH